MHDWFAAGAKPIARKRKGRPIARLQIQDPFEKASGAFKVGRAQRDMIEVHGGPRAMVGVTPPSTRNAAPLVADERGLATVGLQIEDSFEKAIACLFVSGLLALCRQRTNRAFDSGAFRRPPS